MIKIIKKTYWILISMTILFIGLKGLAGNPKTAQLSTRIWQESGPFELSPERGRYALTYSLVENQSFTFSEEIAKFATPDLGIVDGKYVSLFAPGISLLSMPGYFIGKHLGYVQVGTYMTITFFSFLNLLLVYQISKKFGATEKSSIMSALAFSFASPAFAFSGSFFQHHVSTFILLLGIFILQIPLSLVSSFLLWFLYGLAILVDYPNFFMMIPIGISHIIAIYNEVIGKPKIIRNILSYVISTLGISIPLLIFFWFNFKSYGNPLKLAGTANQVIKFENNQPILPTSEQSTSDEQPKSKSVFNMFDSRYLPNGLYVHLFSPDRGLIMFTPVLTFGLLGLSWLYKSKSKHVSILVSILAINIIMYSMFGMGGWSFGSRYLIPAYAMLSIALGYLLGKTKSTLVKIIILVLLVYSYFINIAGGLTSNANPPKVEAIPLSKITGRNEKYTYMRNIDSIIANKSKSFLFNTYLKDKFTSLDLYIGILVILTIISLINTNLFEKDLSNKHV